MPGEYGCKSDAECNHRCPTAFCDEDKTKGLGVCKCDSGFAFSDLCCIIFITARNI